MLFRRKNGDSKNLSIWSILRNVVKEYLFIIIILNTSTSFRSIGQTFNKKGFILCSKNFNDLFKDSTEQCSNKKLNIQWKFSKNSLNENVNTFSEINNITWLFEKNGILIRNGPAMFGQYTHIFDGIAKLTSYKFSENKILFSSQFIRSKWFKNIRKNITLPSITIGPYKWTLLENIQILLNNADFDNNPVNIHQIANTGPIVATTDSPYQIEFNPHTLNTIGKINYKNLIINNGIEMLSTAHPKVMNNYTINYFLEVNTFGKNIAHIVKIDSELNRTIIGSVEVDGIPYIHDFSVTENYVILCIWPLRINLAKILNGKGLLSQTEWFEKKIVRFTFLIFIKQMVNIYIIMKQNHFLLIII